MLFNSWQFLALAAVVYALYFRLPHRGQNWMLLAASYVFYGAWDVRFLGLLLFSTVIDYVAGLRMAAASTQEVRRRWLLLSIVTQLSILGFFKYFNFFIDSAGAALAGLGLPVEALRLDIVLPVGISFYTFQTMSYSIDVYRGKLPATRSFRDFALFVAYFPQLVAGPIERATHLLPQIQNPRRVTVPHIHNGIWLISWGLFKKAVIANNLAILVDRTFASSAAATGPEYLVAIYAFAFQIYCDFSGYSDMARGLASLMGIDLMENFNRPYFATSVRDFWRRWHISLSTWLRDYLYIPLGGNRYGRLRTYRALILTMVLGGLWHGAKWTFVLWGLYHGVLLALYRWAINDRGMRLPDGPAWRALWRLATFHIVCLGWLFFRANDLEQVGTVLASFAGDAMVGTLALKGVAVLVPVFVVLWLGDRVRDGSLPRLAPGRLVAVAALWLAAILLPPSVGQPFIYFQF